jgi:short-subunit dehydrogenase
LHKGLHVLVACPGFTASNIRNTALVKDGTAQGESPREEGKMMQANEVAEFVVLAVINRKRDLVLTMQGKFTLWLNKWFPALTDQLVYNHLANEPDSPLKHL